MQSRLLSTLNAQASSTRDPVVWARAVCRGASHFARHGQTKEALTAIGVVRAQFGPELHHEVASWLMLAEGVLHYFQAQTRESYDRIRRAYGLAVALRTESALPSCAAWMAHVEFFDCAYEKMAVHVEEALTSAQPDDHQAHARAALVLANAYQLAGNYTLARPWYEHARLNAAAEGDDATLSAMLYNVAAFRAANVRLSDAFGEEAASEAHRAGMETASSVNYDYAIGSAGLDFLSEMLRSLMLTIDKRFVEALEVSTTIDMDRVPMGLRGSIYADRAWCRANVGSREEAWADFELARQALLGLSDFDDRAYVGARLMQVANLYGETDVSASLRSGALDDLAKHRQFQADLLSKLQVIRTSKT